MSSAQDGGIRNCQAFFHISWCKPFVPRWMLSTLGLTRCVAHFESLCDSDIFWPSYTIIHIWEWYILCINNFRSPVFCSRDMAEPSKRRRSTTRLVHDHSVPVNQEILGVDSPDWLGGLVLMEFQTLKRLTDLSSLQPCLVYIETGRSKWT